MDQVFHSPSIPIFYSPQFVKNILVKHGWNEERSRDELLMHDPETNDKGSSSSRFGAKAGGSGSQSIQRPYTNMGVVRVTSGPKTTVMVQKPLAAKGGRARRGSSGSEDDDYGVRKGKDDRVYDRYVFLSSSRRVLEWRSKCKKVAGTDRF